MADTAREPGSSVARAGRRTHHRLVGVTFKTAVAAGISWQVATALPAFLPHYAFYAPLGALTVMYSALYDSAVEGLRALSAVTIGVLISVLLHLAVAPSAVTVAVALGLGTVLGNLRKLGGQGSWVPVAALFVFTAGRADTVEYVAGYLCQLSVGAVIGLPVNSVVFPPLALHEVERATRSVRRQIVGVLAAMVDLIEADEQTGDERARQVREALTTLPDTRQRLRESARQARRAQQGNVRQRRWRTDRAHVLALADVSDRAASLVEDLAQEVLEERAVLQRTESERLSAATSALRDVIAQSRDGVPDSELVQRAHDRLDDAAAARSPFVVQRAIAGLRRCLRIATSWTQ